MTSDWACEIGTYEKRPFETNLPLYPFEALIYRKTQSLDKITK